jgi:hypothetical protein
MRLSCVRFTIGRLMAVVAFAAIVGWLLRDPGRWPFVIGFGGIALAFTCGVLVRGRRRAASVCFGVSVVAANGFVAPLCVYCQGSWWVIASVGLLGGIPMALGFGTAWAIEATSPALERLADRVAAGQTPGFPVQAGLYRIVGYEVDPGSGNIALITDANPDGRSGFVRYQLGGPAGRTHAPFSSLFMNMRLNQRWEFEMED